MSQLHMEHHHDPLDHHASAWTDPTSFNTHPSPVHDFGAFATYAPLPLEPLYATAMHPPHPTPRTAHPQLQPLIMPQMPQWPSMLTSQSTYQPALFPSAPVPITPASATPVSASSTHSRTGSTPRKTLTDADRRRMCQYHDDHPTVKQTEIGAMFGVERSTVSKVLRQKEKYLYQHDGSRSPIKRSRGKFPDIERALSNWARNHQRQGLPLSDAMIREKARFFASTVGSDDSHLKANSTSWLEKFKQKNHLMGARSRKPGVAEESEASHPPSSAHTPAPVSPTSPSAVSPTTAVPTQKSEENIKVEGADTFDFSSPRRPLHSQSSTSLSSAFTDAATSTFSAGPTSPSSLSSPFFTPDSACGSNPFGGRQTGGGQPGGNNFQRPRSRTFPMLPGVEQCMSPPGSSDALTPKYAGTGLDSPMAEMANPMAAIEEATSLPSSHSMQPPPLPNTALAALEDKAMTPSQEDAAYALQLVINFFQQSQSADFVVEPQEYVTIGKLMEKLRIKRSPESLSSMRRVSEPALPASQLETVDALP